MARARVNPTRVVVLVSVSIVSLVTALAVAEVALRTAGYRPWRTHRIAVEEPRLNEPHPEFGWWSKEGEFVWGKLTPSLPPIEMTFLPGGQRATSAHPPGGGPRVLLLGGSYTQGWALSDESTFGWRLQATFPELVFLNFGTAAYGTYQTLLRLEDYLKSVARPPALVIYGFADFHEPRNVAAAGWLEGVARQTPGIRLPYATLDAAGKLVRHAPAAYPAWPLGERSALVALLQNRWFLLGARDRGPQAAYVTRALLSEMARTASAHGTSLLVVLLDGFRPGSAAQYAQFLRRREIAVLDCNHLASRQPRMQIPGYGHPNAALNAHWARCIEREVRDRRSSWQDKKPLASLPRQ